MGSGYVAQTGLELAVIHPIASTFPATGITGLYHSVSFFSL